MRISESTKRLDPSDDKYAELGFNLSYAERLERMCGPVPKESTGTKIKVSAEPATKMMRKQRAYCMCNSSNDPTGEGMIQCGTCKKWYHFGCLRKVKTDVSEWVGRKSSVPFNCFVHNIV
jgi:hypothetical protein